ncbi:MAG TPA: Na-translocating system protein MpsC family protein [Thermoleophilaceae bacterium]|nr:Na-translocating system protein MpsC family protein [Thermoleophilaceae bacterium]
MRNLNGASDVAFDIWRRPTRECTPRGGELLASISRRIVQVFAQHAGKGPTKCETHWAGPDMLVVVLGGGYTEAERTLYDRGRAEDVRVPKRDPGRAW